MKIRLNLMNKIKKNIKDIVYISRITKVTKENKDIIFCFPFKYNSIYRYINNFIICEFNNWRNIRNIISSIFY